MLFVYVVASTAVQQFYSFADTVGALLLNAADRKRSIIASEGVENFMYVYPSFAPYINFKTQRFCLKLVACCL